MALDLRRMSGISRQRRTHQGINKGSFLRKIFTDALPIVRFELKFQILILLSDDRIISQEVTKAEHSLNLPMTTDTNMHLMCSYPINVATIEMVACGKVLPPNVAQGAHGSVTRSLISMFRHFNQQVDFRFCCQAGNSRASNMMNIAKLRAEALCYALFLNEKPSRPSAVIGGDFAGERHLHLLPDYEAVAKIRNLRHAGNTSYATASATMSGCWPITRT
jgi:hypothetical protein